VPGTHLGCAFNEGVKGLYDVFADVASADTKCVLSDQQPVWSFRCVGWSKSPGTGYGDDTWTKEIARLTLGETNAQ